MEDIMTRELDAEAQEARADLRAVLDEVGGRFGRHNARSAAHAVIAAAEQGRLTGQTYGYVDWTNGTIYGCVIGISQAVVLGVGHLGDVPSPAFLQRGTDGGRQGHALESYLGDVYEGRRDHPRSALLVEWLAAWLDDEAREHATRS